ncbi:MAG: hypothetical protein CME70_19105 [Halobacteriovorax sp.]|nr:hypothetical protein [Halobacteriovorax sp.]
MKAGDLVKHVIHKHLGLGLITSIDEGYAWVAFQGWVECDKWCDLKTLVLISECNVGSINE